MVFKSNRGLSPHTAQRPWNKMENNADLPVLSAMLKYCRQVLITGKKPSLLATEESMVSISKLCNREPRRGK